MRFCCQLSFIFAPKKIPKSRLGAVLGRLGRVLGRLGGHLGRLRVILESSWAVLEASEAVLEASGAPCLLPQDNTQRASAVLGGPRGAANIPPVSP